jgi:hypothetical protein
MPHFLSGIGEGIGGSNVHKLLIAVLLAVAGGMTLLLRIGAACEPVRLNSSINFA